MKKLGYRLFALIYYICCIFPRNKKKVFCIMTHDGSAGSNVGVMIQELKRRGQYQFEVLKKEERDQIAKQGKIKGLLDFFLIKPYHMATCSYILQDNVFLPMAYMRFPKSVKVVQLWHGTGTIKKFGQSVNIGELACLEKAADDTITHLIVNSEATREIYAEAFGLPDSKVYELGLPRTDLLFDSEKVEALRNQFIKKHPELKDKRLILYAPTFRDREAEHPRLPFDPSSFLTQLPEDMVLGLKLHPFVARGFDLVDLPEQLKEKVCNLSFEGDTNQLLAAADILITDYSSIIFEYLVLQKPMIFYAYDYKDFDAHQRGFYKEYTEFVPGPVVYTEEELVKQLKCGVYDMERIRRFFKEQYCYSDGQSAKRIADTVFKA